MENRTLAHLSTEGGFVAAPPVAKAHYLAEFTAIGLILAFIIYALFTGKK